MAPLKYGITVFSIRFSRGKCRSKTANMKGVQLLVLLIAASAIFPLFGAEENNKSKLFDIRIGPSVYANVFIYVKVLHYGAV